MRPRRPDRALAELLVSAAEEWIGHRCVTGAQNEFARRVGYAGHDAPWSGAFLDCVARDAGLGGLPSLTGATAGLGELLACRRAVLSPRRGDVVFFSFPTVGHFTGPHVGLVTDVSDWRTLGEFVTVEAQVNAGLPRSPRDADGVYNRRRSRHDVLAFCRPALTRRPEQGAPVQTGPLVTIAQLRSGRANDAIELVQRALAVIFPQAGLSKAFRADGHARALPTRRWDAATRRAYARWQRSIGFVGPDAPGDPDPASLARLSRESGVFRVED